MADIFDYIKWRGDLTFRQSSFNPVDNIILTHLSYLPLDNIVPGIDEAGAITIAEAAAVLGKALIKNPKNFKTLLTFKQDPDFLAALGASARYKDMGLAGYVNQLDPDQEKQFAALTILTGNGSSFITYRGTDNSLVGWKEDFNMSFNAEVPAQAEAVRYLEAMAKRYRGSLRTGGHSKGGNLAVYAASFCSRGVRKRISGVYTNDSPGFSSRVLESEGYLAVRDRINAFVPETSIVGMIFEHKNKHTVVKSSQTGLLQHDIYSWELTHNDLVRLEKTNKESRFIHRTLIEWKDGLDQEQRRGFTDALFTILSSTEASSIPELTSDWLKSAGLMIQTLTLNETSRDMVFKTLGALFQAAKNNFHTLLPPPAKKGKGPEEGARSRTKVK
jgi:hypothetical protein